MCLLLSCKLSAAHIHLTWLTRERKMKLRAHNSTNHIAALLCSLVLLLVCFWLSSAKADDWETVLDSNPLVNETEGEKTLDGKIYNNVLTPPARLSTGIYRWDMTSKALRDCLCKCPTSGRNNQNCTYDIGGASPKEPDTYNSGQCLCPTRRFILPPKSKGADSNTMKCVEQCEKQITENPTNIVERNKYYYHRFQVCYDIVDAEVNNRLPKLRKIRSAEEKKQLYEDMTKANYAQIAVGSRVKYSKLKKGGKHELKAGDILMLSHSNPIPKYVPGSRQPITSPHYALVREEGIYHIMNFAQGGAFDGIHSIDWFFNGSDITNPFTHKRYKDKFNEKYWALYRKQYFALFQVCLPSVKKHKRIRRVENESKEDWKKRKTAHIKSLRFDDFEFNHILPLKQYALIVKVSEKAFKPYPGDFFTTDTPYSMRYSKISNKSGSSSGILLLINKGQYGSLEDLLHNHSEISETKKTKEGIVSITEEKGTVFKQEKHTSLRAVAEAYPDIANIEETLNDVALFTELNSAATSKTDNSATWGPFTKGWSRQNKEDAIKLVRPCLLIDAVYGAPNSPQITIFRNFRDKVLKKSKTGKHLIQLYYKYSPEYTILLKKNSRFIPAIRWSLDLLASKLERIDYDKPQFRLELDAHLKKIDQIATIFLQHDKRDGVEQGNLTPAAMILAISGDIAP